MVIRFLITKTLITAIMKELVVITEITVIKLIYRRNSMEKKTEKDKETKEQTNKPDLIKKLVT